MRQPCPSPINGKSASFRSCVRAGEAKLRVCVREIMLLYAGLSILEFLSSPPSSPSSPPSPPPVIEHCILHGFYQLSYFFVDICMGLMHFRRFLNVLHGFYRFSLIIAVACMGFISFS